MYRELFDGWAAFYRESRDGLDSQRLPISCIVNPG